MTLGGISLCKFWEPFVYVYCVNSEKLLCHTLKNVQRLHPETFNFFKTISLTIFRPRMSFVRSSESFDVGNKP